MKNKKVTKKKLDVHTQHTDELDIKLYIVISFGLGLLTGIAVENVGLLVELFIR